MLRRFVMSTSISIAAAACGAGRSESEAPAQLQEIPANPQGTTDRNNSTSPDDKMQELERRIAALAGTQDRLQQVVMSDFSTCEQTGESADPLINKICRVAQAATVEAKALLKGELSSAMVVLGDKLESLSGNLSRLQDSTSADKEELDQAIMDLSRRIAELSASVATLQSRLTTVESAIAALQSMTASIQGALRSSMQELEIGSENLAAGPVYATLLRRADRSRIVGYAEVTGPALSLPNSPLRTTKDSDQVAVSSAGHGLLAGNVVRLSDLTEGGGLSSGDLTGEFTVVAVADAGHFTIQARREATSSQSFGGSLGVAQKLIGRGLMTIWETADGADTGVRTTTLGTARYNFVVTQSGDVCYSRTNPSATLAEITGGSERVCK